MTKKEFKEKYGIAWGTVQKQIDDVWSKYYNMPDGEYRMELREVIKQVGFREYVGTGKYEIKNVYHYYDEKDKEWEAKYSTAYGRAEKREAEILALYNGDFQKTKEDTVLLAKRKHYLERIAELEKELAEKKEWLANNPE